MQQEKPDLDRLGIFKELSYTTVGEPYVPPRSPLVVTRTNPRGIPPMYLAGGYSKVKSGNIDGYFAPFESIHIGDGNVRYADIMRASIKASKEKRIGKGEWIPSGKTKQRSGTGSSYGNFQEHYDALDPSRKMVPRVPQMKNFYTNPGKKGTGYGYTDICLNPYPNSSVGDSPGEVAHRMFVAQTNDHIAKLKGRSPFVSMCRTLDPFDENPWAEGDPLAPGGPSTVKFGVAAFPKSMMIGPTFVPSHPAKWDGGMKDGALNPFPEYSSEPYFELQRAQKEDRSKFIGPQWVPNPDTALVIPTPSVVAKNTDLRINSKTRKHRHKVWDAC